MTRYPRRTNTRPRDRQALIEQALTYHTGFATAESVWLYLRNQKIHVSLGTIYNGLRQLTAVGIVSRRKGDDRKDQFLWIGYN